MSGMISLNAPVSYRGRPAVVKGIDPDTASKTPYLIELTATRTSFWVGEEEIGEGKTKAEETKASGRYRQS
jgi:hypothetical protein